MPPRSGRPAPASLRARQVPRSYSEPSPIARSTLRPSWSSICASDNSGMAASPRRSSASQACALSIACSPPLTVHRPSSALLDRHAARQGGQRCPGAQDNVHTAREQCMVLLPFRNEPRRQAAHQTARGLTQARPTQSIAGAAAKCGDLQDQGGGVPRVPRAIRPQTGSGQATTTPLRSVPRQARRRSRRRSERPASHVPARRSGQARAASRYRPWSAARPLSHDPAALKPRVDRRLDAKFPAAPSHQA